MPSETRKAETRKLDNDSSTAATAEPTTKPQHRGIRETRIALRILPLQVELVFNLQGAMVVGRSHPESNFYPDIDLSAFQGGDLVSREHLFFKLDDDRVVVVDNKSANGTKLNGEWLKPLEAYPITHGDELTLGVMKMQVELLTNMYD